VGLDRAVRKETYYGLECPTIESLCRRYFLTCPNGMETPSAFCIIGTGTAAMRKAVRAFRWPHTRSSAEVQKQSTGIHLLPLFVFMACQIVNITIHNFIHWNYWWEWKCVKCNWHYSSDWKILVLCTSL